MPDRLWDTAHNRIVIQGFSWSDGSTLPTGPTDGTVPVPPEGGWVWVDVSGESPETIRRICTSFQVDAYFIEEALTAGSLPVLEEQRDLIYVVLNSFGTQEDGRLGPGEVDIFVGENFILSVHDRDLFSTSLVVERFEQGIGLTAPSPAGLLAHLAMVGSRRLPPLIDQLEIQLDSLEELAMRADPRALNEVYALRRDVIVLRRVLVPQRQIYDELAEGGHPLIDEVSRRAFEKVADYQNQILESLEAARSLLGSVFETHRGAVADQTNEIVRVLTVFSAIMLPLGLIAGIFGMNFIDIPLAEQTWGFWVLVGAMAVGAIALWLYFGRRGFVGAPRLSELPRAVGLGLYQVGAAPIKVVAGGIESTIRLVTGTPAEPPRDDEG